MNLHGLDDIRAPDLGLHGDELLIRFPVRDMPRATVLWLNTRWWLSQGWDILSPPVRREVETCLLERFGVRSDLQSQAPTVKYLEADRYGGSFGTKHHGGSGRCGVAGRFNAKGIGPTLS